MDPTVLEEQLYRVLEEAPIPTVMYAENGEVLQISRSFTELTGYKLSDIGTLDALLARTYGEGANALRAHLPALFDGKPRPIDTELCLRTRSGKTRYWSFTASSPGRLRDGRRFVVGMAQDITDRKRAEEALKKSHDELEHQVGERTAELREQTQSAIRDRDRLRTLIDSINDGVWFTRPDGRMVLANSIARRQAAEVGIEPDLLLNFPAPSLLSEVDILTPDGKALDVRPLMKVFQGKSHSGVEISIRNRKTGGVFHRRISSNPILDAAGHIEGVITVTQDITAEKRADEERAVIEEQLRQGQKMEAVGTLAGGIAHDFNNMLAVILGNAELALDDVQGNHGPKHNIEQIVKASKRARDLVKQILAFSRKTERGKNPLMLTPVLKEISKLLRGSLPSTIRMELDLHAESDVVLADPSQVEQVLMNLATNAAYAMRKKGGDLKISLSNVKIRPDGPKPDDDLAPGTYVKMSVQDTGTGMTDTVRRRIFEPFFTTKKAGQGTGMGLAVVYGIVKNHGGAVTLDTEPDKGSTFNVFLPSVQTPAKQEKEAKGGVPGGTERILLVDDEPSVLEMVSHTLARLGYSVTSALSGSEAWGTFIECPDAFDLLITDQTMPDITGIELAEKMLEARKDLPVILITGYSESVSPEQAKAAGVSEFVMKPFAKQEVAKTIRRVLTQRERERRKRKG